MASTCSNLPPEQRAALMPWGIFSAAAMIVYFVIMAAAVCYLALFKDADFRIGGTMIMGSLLLRRLAERIYIDRESHITGITPQPGAVWSWRMMILCLIFLLCLFWWKP